MFELRLYQPDDLPLLVSLSRQTFFETFRDSNTAENMEAYLKNELSEAKLQAETLNPESRFWFAKDGTMAIGYLKINWGAAQMEFQETDGLEIERIYVLQSHLGTGVAQLLFQKAEETAVQQGRKYLWLGVWEHNPRAIRFYEKNGFRQFSQHVFKVGDDAQTDVLMRKNLQAALVREI